jgi:hypothetical protein
MAPLAPGQHGVAITTSTGLAVPAGATFATVCARGVALNCTTDGVTAPTSSVRMPLAAAACVSLAGPAVLANFRALSATGTLDAEYFQ